MTSLPMARPVLGAAVVVIPQIAVFSALKALYRVIPEYHAFWSGLVMYAAVLSLPLLPLAMVPLVLRRPRPSAHRAAALASAWSIVALVVAFAPAGGNRLDYWAWDAAGVFVVLAATMRRPTAP